MVTIETTVHIFKEGEHYIAHATPIDVASSGPTPEAARSALDDAIRVFVHTADVAGTLEQVLEEAGYVFEQGQWASPAFVAIERHAIAV